MMKAYLPPLRVKMRRYIINNLYIILILYTIITLVHTINNIAPAAGK